MWLELTDEDYKAAKKELVAKMAPMVAGRVSPTKAATG